MEKKEITQSLEDLAKILALKLKKCCVIVKLSDDVIKIYPADDDHQLERCSIISSTAIGHIIEFCNLHSLSFYVTTSIEYQCAELVIY